MVRVAGEVRLKAKPQTGGRSLADAELGEDDVEEVFGHDVAGDGAQGGVSVAQVGGDDETIAPAVTRPHKLYTGFSTAWAC